MPYTDTPDGAIQWPKGKQPRQRAFTPAAFARHEDTVLIKSRLDGQNVTLAISLPSMLETLKRISPDYHLWWHHTPQRVKKTPEKVRSPKPPVGMTLSVAMIVKNEEKFLAQCLDTVKDIADEIVIVDTGSTDKTVEIARRYTDKVYFHEWQNSFSEARNHSLDYCTCDWILQIDADEELLDPHLVRPTMEALRQRPHVDSVVVPILSETTVGDISRTMFPRLFHREGCHYEGIIHNQLKHPGEDVTADIRFLHHGYNLSPEELERKNQLMTQKLERQLEESPENSFAWANLFDVWHAQNRWQDILDNAHRVLDKADPVKGEWQRTAYLCVVAYMNRKQWQAALDMGLKALEKWPDNLDIMLVLAVVYDELNRPEDAIPMLKRNLAGLYGERAMEKRPVGINLHSYGMEPAIWRTLAKNYAVLDRMAEAEACVAQAEKV